MTHRVSASGSFRFDRTFPRAAAYGGTLRIAKASGVYRQREFDQLDAFLSLLYARGRFDLLRAIDTKQFTVLQLYALELEGKLQSAAIDHRLGLALWPAVDAWVPRSAAALGTRRRYEVSFHALKRAKVLATDARIEDLGTVDWTGLRLTWAAGPADWNHLRRAISRFCTVILGDKHHPFRRQLVEAIPIAAEPPGRMPDVTPSLFWKLVRRMPTPAQPYPVALVGTGMRIGELLACDAEDLLPHTKALSLATAGEKGAKATLPIDEELWPWLVAAIPAQLTYKQIRKLWKDACDAEGVKDLRLHDLRHCFGQWLSDAGRSEASIQASLRHKTAAMTRRYTMRKLRREDASAIAGVLFPKPKAKRASRAKAS